MEEGLETNYLSIGMMYGMCVEQCLHSGYKLLLQQQNGKYLINEVLPFAIELFSYMQS